MREDRELMKHAPPKSPSEPDAPADPSMTELALHVAPGLEDLRSGVHPLLQPEAPTKEQSLEREARLRRMVDTHIDFVARVLRNAGTPAAEVDDEVQRTFITVARRLDRRACGFGEELSFADRAQRGGSRAPYRGAPA